MSSKSDKEATPADPAPLPSRSWSISHRLIAHYSLSAFVIFNLSIALVHLGLVAITEKQSNRYLQDEINVIERLYKAGKDLKPLEQKLEVGYAAREFMKTYSRILDAKGQVILQTHLMAKIVPATVFPQPTGNKYPGKGIRWKDENGKAYLLRTLWLGDAGANGNRRILQIALDISHLDRIVKDFREILLAVIIFGTVISAVLAAIIVRKGLRPLKEITERTMHITAYNLDERMNMPHWPKEVKTLAIAFDDMLDRLQDSFDRLSSYVSNMAHELRTPINVLMGEAEVALTKARTSSDYRRVIESNLEEYGRLSRIIDSLLFIARTDIKKSTLLREEIIVSQEVKKIVEYYQPLADDKELSITWTGNATLSADPTLFRRAISNLLSNAIHYTTSGGRIEISTRQADNLSIEVTVADTGCGMCKEELPKIFDRFYRVDTSRHVHPEGTGLGLAIVKSIMDLHGGTVSIESEPSKGTSVTLKFPPSNITKSS